MPVLALAPDPAGRPVRVEGASGSPSAGSTSASTPAAPAAVAPAGYQTAAELGFQEYERGNYEEARARFLQAHRLWPNARVLRALGHCEFELAHYVAAVEFLQQTLASSERPLSELQRRETEALLARAESHVARIVVRTLPRQAHVLIDGADPKQDVHGAVMLAAGPHTIEVHAAGYQPGQRELRVEGKLDRVVQVELTPEPARTAGQADEVPLRKKWWVWASAAAVGTAGLATVLALSLRDSGQGRVDGGSTDMVIPVGRADGASR